MDEPSSAGVGLEGPLAEHPSVSHQPVSHQP
jgi:hypothetical protein